MHNHKHFPQINSNRNNINNNNIFQAEGEGEGGGREVAAEEEGESGLALFTVGRIFIRLPVGCCL